MQVLPDDDLIIIAAFLCSREQRALHIATSQEVLKTKLYGDIRHLTIMWSGCTGAQTPGHAAIYLSDGCVNRPGRPSGVVDTKMPALQCFPNLQWVDLHNADMCKECMYDFVGQAAGCQNLEKFKLHQRLHHEATPSPGWILERAEWLQKNSGDNLKEINVRVDWIQHLDRLPGMYVPWPTLHTRGHPWDMWDEPARWQAEGWTVEKWDALSSREIGRMYKTRGSCTLDCTWPGRAGFI
jgi:hypothetical protein